MKRPDFLGKKFGFCSRQTAHNTIESTLKGALYCINASYGAWMRRHRADEPEPGPRKISPEIYSRANPSIII